MTLFLDRPASGFESATAFWSTVTGTTPSATRGADRKFLTRVPTNGDAFLRMQRVGSGGGSHLDLHVDDVRAAADRWIEIGATEVAGLDGVVVLRSPGGLRFCSVSHHGEHRRPAPVSMGGGTRTIVDQVCIDIAPDRFEDECEFWSKVTDRTLVPGGEPEFCVLERSSGEPLRFLMQRRGDGDRGGATECHVDIACDDVDAARSAHEALGARLVAEYTWWTVMADPAGAAYCLTGRSPDTGRSI